MDIPSLVAQTAASMGVDPSLALGVAAAESNFNPNAISKAGAIGVMQVEPGTAAGLGVNPYDVVQNIQGGIRYLAEQLAAFGGDVAAALAAYNWGPGAVRQAMASAGAGWLSTAPAETQAYVEKILGSVPAPSELATPADGSSADVYTPPSGGVTSWLLPAGLAAGALVVLSLFDVF